MKKILIIFIMLFSLTFISASGGLTLDCYQETTNVSTACGGLNTGTYSWEGSWDAANQQLLVFDEDWGTAGGASAGVTASVYINYTIPNGAMDTSKLEAKLGVGLTIYANISINESCWDNGIATDTLKFKFSSQQSGNTNSNVSCYDGSNWILMRQTDLGVSNNHQMYEEAMVWDFNYYAILNSPSDDDYSANQITVNCTAGSNETLSNVSLYSNYTGSWTLINTTSITGTSNESIFSNLLPSGRYGFTCGACDNVGCGYARDNITLNVNVMQDNTFFGFCNASLVTKFLNITFKDETTNSFINASIPSSIFTYYRGSPIINKTFSFTNNTDNFEYDFCASPNITLSVIPFVQYKQGTAYPQRIWNPSAVDYTNQTTNQTLYLLGSSDGIYVTFQVINSADQVLSGVDVTATRSVNGIDTVVGTGTTGASGTVTYWLNPDYVHEFSFSKTGYTTYTYSDTPTQTSYTITLTGGSTVYNNYFQGISYTLLPKGSLVNNTDYSFELNLSSSFWDVDSFGFNLRLANGTIAGSDSSVIIESPATLTYNTKNQSIIYMDYYWIIDGNYTNATKYWVIYNSGQTDWSIANFFTDLNSYLDEGIFGIDNFGRYLIVFIILFLTVGIMSYKFGFTSPLSITTLTFAIILFFEVVVDVIPPIRGIDNLLTYISALVLLIVIIGEVQR